MLLDVDDALGEARLLHPGAAGYFAVLRRTAAGGMSSRCYRMGQMEPVLHALRRAPDVYMSQGSFIAPRRQVKFLHQMRAAWVDLDCYTLGESPSEGFVADVVATASAMGVPQPSYVVRSGRGLYAKWLFEQPIGAGQLLQWRELQNTLVAIYRSIGADAKAKDAARVLRALGTTNSKAGERDRVEICWNSGELVDFTDLCAGAASARFAGRVADAASPRWDDELAAQEQAACTAERRAQARQGRAAHRLGARMAIDGPSDTLTNLEGLRLFGDAREPILMDARSSSSLNWRRFLDLRNLAIKRGGIERGYRDEYLFWMTTFLGHADVITKHNFWSEVGDLAQTMDPHGFDPVNDGSMGTLYRKICEKWSGKSAQKRSPLYTATSAHLIELFEITAEEQREMLTLIAPTEKTRRRDAQIPGRAERREERARLHTQAAQMLAAGKPAAAVALHLGIAKWQVYRIKEKLEPLACSGGGAAEAAAPRRRPAVRAGGELLNRIACMLSRGMSSKVIRADLHLGESALYRAKKELLRLHLLAEPLGHAEAANGAAQTQARSELAQQANAAKVQARQLRAQAHQAQSRLSSALALTRLKEALVRSGIEQNDLFEPAGDSRRTATTACPEQSRIADLGRHANAAEAQARLLFDELLRRPDLQVGYPGQSDSPIPASEGAVQHERDERGIDTDRAAIDVERQDLAGQAGQAQQGQAGTCEVHRGPVGNARDTPTNAAGPAAGKTTGGRSRRPRRVAGSGPPGQSS